MSEQHTAGPWTVTGREHTAGWGLCVSAGNLIIAQMRGPRGAEKDANARLISIAPALLNLLEALIPIAEAGVGVYLDEHSNAEERPGHRDGLLASIEDARDAVAVARGA